MLSIFVSSTSCDLDEYRQEVRKLIAALGFKDIAWETWPPSWKPPKSEIDEALRNSDIYVGLFAWRYGSLLEDEKKSYCQYEYEYAGRLGLPRLVFLAHPEFPVPPINVDKGEAGNNMEMFRTQIENTRDITWKYFTTPIDLLGNLSAALFKIVTQLDKYRSLQADDRMLFCLRQAINDDFLARRKETETSGPLVRDWFLPQVARCNVRPQYVEREELKNAVAGWFLHGELPYLFLLGPSGIGKTNFLLDWIYLLTTQQLARPSEHLSSDPVLFLFLGAYDPEKDLAANLATSLDHGPLKSLKIYPDTVTRLFQQRKVLLILDGLDQFVRNHSERKASVLLQSIATYASSYGARVIVSCRDHIFKRLKHGDASKILGLSTTIRVTSFSRSEILRMMEVRLGKGSLAYSIITSSKPIMQFAANPLVLEMMCRIPLESWKRLGKYQNLGSLYDVWFEEIILASGDPRMFLTDESVETTRGKVGKIAAIMLNNRTEFISEATLEQVSLPVECLEELTRQPFGIFTRQTKDEWSFVHDSFREFALAKTVAVELVSGKYDLLTTTPSLDYVGAETYLFVRDLIPDDQDLSARAGHAIDNSEFKGEAWNNIARNCFEAIGMIAERSVEGFIDRAVRLLEEPGYGGMATENRKLTIRTKYNIVRCLERLHSSAPQPYYQHVLARNWPSEPSWGCFGAAAVRGFHRQKPELGCFPPIVYLWRTNTSDSYKQREVSGCLIRILELARDSRCKAASDPQRTFLDVNCTHALIRWLHECDIERLKKLLSTKDLAPSARGNLFLALQRFKQPGLFRECTDLFDGMELGWVYISRRHVSEDFRFRNVTFLSHESCILEGFSPDAFEECHYK